MTFFNRTSKKEKEEELASYYQTESVQLPPNFAQSVMDLQMQLEFTETYSMEVVQQLNEMYRIAIEYYINEDPRKANHFQKKLTSMLTNPQTLNLIEKKPVHAKNVELNPARYTTHLRTELNRFNTQSQIVIKSMIEGANKKHEKSQRIMSENIESQEDRLKRRLEERSRSKKKTLTVD